MLPSIVEVETGVGQGRQATLIVDGSYYDHELYLFFQPDTFKVLLKLRFQQGFVDIEAIDANTPCGDVLNKMTVDYVWDGYSDRDNTDEEVNCG